MLLKIDVPTSTEIILGKKDQECNLKIFPFISREKIFIFFFSIPLYFWSRIATGLPFDYSPPLPPPPSPPPLSCQNEALCSLLIHCMSCIFPYMVLLMSLSLSASVFFLGFVLFPCIGNLF